ncbi:MAG: transcriptional repressor [Pseudomonadota bacterium]
MTDFSAHATLEKHGLRATRPRLSVTRVLFGDGENRHVTAEWVAERLQHSGEGVALATVYNTLHNFSDAGLLREVHGAERGAIIFDTNTSPHHHYYNETTKKLTDIPSQEIQVLGLPEPPDGAVVVGWDVVVRLR